MPKVTVSASFLQAVKGATSAVELFDDNGAPVGFFVPPISPPAKTNWLDPPISAEELKRREREGSYISTAELLRRLEAL